MVSGHRLPSLPSIGAFEAAARLGSFAKAARELDTSSAAVSYHVRRLEQQIGVPLFVRHPNHVCLTQSGEIVAREAMNAFAALRASFIRAVDADEARLSLTTLPTLGTSWLTPKLGRFRSRCPDILLGLDLSANPRGLDGGSFRRRHSQRSWKLARAAHGQIAAEHLHAALYTDTEECSCEHREPAFSATGPAAGPT